MVLHTGPFCGTLRSTPRIARNAEGLCGLRVGCVCVCFIDERVWTTMEAGSQPVEYAGRWGCVMCWCVCHAGGVLMQEIVFFSFLFPLIRPSALFSIVLFCCGNEKTTRKRLIRGRDAKRKQQKVAANVSGGETPPLHVTVTKEGGKTKEGSWEEASGKRECVETGLGKRAGGWLFNVFYVLSCLSLFMSYGGINLFSVYDMFLYFIL